MNTARKNRATRRSPASERPTISRKPGHLSSSGKDLERLAKGQRPVADGRPATSALGLLGGVGRRDVVGGDVLGLLDVGHLCV